MPATAGRVPMPKGNRMETSGSLKTHGIWQNAIGYDPYAPEGGDEQQTSLKKRRRATTSSQNQTGNAQGSGEGAGTANESTNMQAQDIVSLAKASSDAAHTEARGLWKGRGRIKGLWEPGRGIPQPYDDGPPDMSFEETAHAAAAVATNGSPTNEPQHGSGGATAYTEHALQKDRESSRKRHKCRKHKKRRREHSKSDTEDDSDAANASSDESKSRHGGAKSSDDDSEPGENQRERKQSKHKHKHKHKHRRKHRRTDRASSTPEESQHWSKRKRDTSTCDSAQEDNNDLSRTERDLKRRNKKRRSSCQ